jgi:imidazole glycerol-phosphate synthase subunit HisH
MIGIVDLDMGNLRSVANAVAAAGETSRWVRTPTDLEAVTHAILPGVGSFRVAAERLATTGLLRELRAWASEGKPLLGICLGMQLLASYGEEGGGAEGLSVVPGRVVRFEDGTVPSIPHVGWNEAKLTKPHPLFERVRSAVDFYYVHSFHLVADRGEDVLATLEYGGRTFTSAVAHGSVVGLQFHPEKSQANGLRLVENFCYWDGAC